MIDQTINLREWDNIVVDEIEIKDAIDRNTIETLKEKGILEITELKEGISISSNSYVGRIKIGSLQINVYPKLNGMPLYQLLRFTYGLRELKLFSYADHSIDNFSFFDLLIYELYIETEDLLRKGIQKNYISREEDLNSPRGRINLNKLCNQGSLITNTLPCKYFSRDENNQLNKILLAGIKLGQNLVLDSDLKVQLQRLSLNIEEQVDDIFLTRANLQQARSSINRLTERYYSILEIINILYESQGIQLKDSSSYISLRGYFFDMNIFFETLVGRLLERYCEGYSIKDQFSLHKMFMYTPGFNPCRRKSPTPRPDFALMKEGKVIKLLDAKYRDLWELSLPREMLYQLAIYAISGMGDRTATIIYPSIDDIPSIQKVNVNDPIYNSKIATVILKPLNLLKVTDLLSKNSNDLKSYINSLIS